MALTKDQLDWVLNLAGMEAAIGSAVSAENAKREAIDAAWKVLDAKVTEIRIGEDFVMEMAKGGLKGFLRQKFKAGPETQRAIAADGDADDEFDIGHDLADSAGLTPVQLEMLLSSHAIIVAEVDKLRAERHPVTGKRLLADVEIAREIWEPLMRRKIIPENAITDQYSDVARTFEAASETYDERLAAYTESVSSSAGLAAKLGLSSEIIGGINTAATGIMTALTAAVPEMKSFALSEAVGIATAITITLQAPLDIAATVLRDNGKLTSENVQAIARTVITGATTWVAAGFLAKFPGGSVSDQIGRELGSAINAGLQMGLSGAGFAIKIVEGKGSEAFDDLADIVQQCCTCAAAGLAVATDQRNDKALENVGAIIADTMKAGKEMVLLTQVAQAKDPIEAVTEALQNIVKAAINAGAGIYQREMNNAHFAQDLATQQTKDDAAKGEAAAELRDQGLDAAQREAIADKTDKERDEDQEGFNQSEEKYENFTGTPLEGAKDRVLDAVSPEGLSIANLLKLAQTRTPDQLKKLFAEDPRLKADTKIQKLMLDAAETRDKALKTAAAIMDQQVADDARRFRAILSGSQARASDADVDSIEALILQIKKDQMIVALAESLLKLGPAAVAAFLPPAAIAVDAIQLAISMRKAAEHFMAWKEWNDNVTDATSAMSVQVAAMANRAGISMSKGIQESIRALEAGIKLVGDGIGTTGGPFAGAGIAVSRGVSAVSAIKDVIVSIYDEKELAANWKKYEKARRSPDDRKAVRDAIRGNATLAKYTIAYGAVIAEDPVAKNALNKCGLSTKILQSKDTDAQKVVTYLEVLYADDPVVLKRLPDAPTWHPGPIALTTTSVAAFSHAGKNARPAMQPINPELPKALVTLDTTRAAAATAAAAWEAAGKVSAPDLEMVEAARVDYVAALEVFKRSASSVRVRVISWKPVDSQNTPHKEGLAYQSELRHMAEGLFKKAEQDAADAPEKP